MIAIYARQSVDRKEKDSISIEAQIEFCKREVDINDNREVKVYTDKGFSGKNINRPAFEELLNSIKNGYIDKVIVYKLDRVSRSILDFANLINLFKEYNVEFLSSTEKFDTSMMISKTILYIIMAFAELEREVIIQRVTDNYYIRGAKGFFLGGRTPYGFIKEKTKIDGKNTSMLKSNSETMEHVKKMYELYATTNMSLGEISNYFNKLNIPSASNKNWDSGKISRMLKSPLYVKSDADIYVYYKKKKSIITNDLSEFIGENGCYLFGKRKPNERKYTNVEDHTLVIAPHKGEVDSRIWLNCQYKLDSNKQIKNTGKGKHSWLSGLIKCAHCNYALTVVISNNKYRYLYCRGKTNYKVCDKFSKAIKADKIEKTIEKSLLNRISKNKELSKNKSINQQKNNGSDNLKSNKLKMELIELEDKIENMINQIADGNKIAMKYINEKITKLDNRKNEILEEIEKNIINDNKSNVDIDDVFEKSNNWNKLSLEDKKEICSVYINKIFIASDDDVKIDWKI